MTDATGTTVRTFDELGRVLTKTVPNVGTITYEYDITVGVEPGCKIERSIDPKGNRMDKVYDKAGRLSKVIVGNEVTTYTYFDNGNRESVTYNDGTKEVYTYYANNQIETLVNKRADGSIMDTYRYTYDAAGNQLTKYEVIGGQEKGTTTYTYDALNRLETVTAPNGRVTTYTYDKAGNREKEAIIAEDNETGTVTTIINTYTYNNQNRLTEINTRVNNVPTEVTSYTYDNNGNQLEVRVKSYENGVETANTIKATNTYDLRNQLIRTITADGTVVENSYNAEGYRTIKEVGGEKTYYLYEADKVILEVDEAGNQKARNVYGTNLLMRTVDGETYYYLYNGHADVTALVTSNGTVAATYYYDSFGNILESSCEVNNNILYSGYQYDEETGLYYLNARMYDPKIARFLQEDTYTGQADDPLSLNLYTYCYNNPIRYWDPTGHRVVYEDGANISRNRKTEISKSSNDKSNLLEKYTADTFLDLDLNISPYCDIGTAGPYVRESEKILYNLGYLKEIDHVFGYDDQYALKRFQSDYQKYGLRVNGVIEQRTFAYLQVAETIEKAKIYVKRKAMDQSEFEAFSSSLMKKVRKVPYKFKEGNDFVQRQSDINYAYFTFSMEISNTLLSFYPQDEAVDIAFLVYDIAKYDGSDSSKWQIGLDVGALFLDVGFEYLDEIADARKAATSLKEVEGTSKTTPKTTLDYLKDIEVKNGNYYASKATIDEIGKIEAKGVDFSKLDSKVMSLRASTEGGISKVIKYSDGNGTKFIIHEVTDAKGNIIHRDFDAVRIESGQLINKK